MKTIFLTGSQGFIGRHLLPKLVGLGYNVYCGGRDELPKVNYDYLIHLAAVTTTSNEFNPRIFNSNILYTYNVMASHLFDRVIYASSTSAAEMTNIYAHTKRYAEHLGMAINSTGLRFFNVYGPNNSKGIVKKAIECAKSGEILTVAGGLQIRDFIYIDDVVRAIIDALDSTEKIIEVGTGIGMTIEQALNKISDAVEQQVKVNYIKSDPTDMLVSVAKPGITGCLVFEDGISRMI